MNFAVIVIAQLLTLACSSGGFRATGGGGGQTAQVASPTPSQQPFQDRVDEAEPTIQPVLGKAPGGLATDQGTVVIQPNYQACASQPQAGRVKYPAKCNANEVMSVINDGKTQEMTCCPLQGTNILSTNAAEQFQERTGSCQADEVGVGMISAEGSRIYCTKINTQFLKLGPPEAAIYASSSKGLTSAMETIAASYNVKDCCICPDRKILIGGHITKDNSCEDRCVEILPK